MHEIYNVLTALLMIMQEMHFLRHKKLTSKQGAARCGSNQTGFSDGGIQSNRSKGNQGVQSNKSKGAHVGSSERSIAAGVKFKRVNTRRAGAHTESSGRSSADGVNSILVAEGGVNSTMVGADCEHSERNNANGASHGVNTQLNGASDGVNSQLNGASDGGNSHVNIGSKRVLGDAPKKGRAKMSRTELKMAPRSGRVELAPKGHW